MTILVTGGAGYIGSHVVLELINSGQEVVILDDLSVGRRSSLDSDAMLYMGDIGDTGLVTRIILAHDVKAVIHLAAVTSVPYSVANPDETYLTNTTKSQAFLEACLTAGVCRFVFSSVSAVYGEPQTHQVTEDQPIAPNTPYGGSKAAFEAILAKAHDRYDFTHAIVRCFNVAGVDKDQRVPQWPDSPTHLVKLAAMAAIGMSDSISINGTDYGTHDGTCVRDYIHVTDAARGHIQALEYLQAGNPSTIINLGSGLGTSVMEIIKTAQKLGTHEFEIKENSRREGDPAILVAETSHAKNTINWNPEYSDIEVIIHSAIEWEKTCAGI